MRTPPTVSQSSSTRRRPGRIELLLLLAVAAWLTVQLARGTCSMCLVTYPPGMDISPAAIEPGP